MSPPGRPEGEFLSAQREGHPIFPPGRPMRVLPPGVTAPHEVAKGAR
jgi:hypothetical protein